jgi:hypothetical protein
VDLIDGLMLAQVQLPNQQHDIQSKRKTRQRLGIGLWTPVRPLMPRTLGIRATKTCVDEPDHFV